MKEYHIISLGAGVQSTMLYLLACERNPVMPPIDCAIFADPGDEGDDVYEHLEWLKSLGGPPILVRSAGNLGDELMQKNDGTKRRFSAIPCFTDNEGCDTGMGKRQCTYDYKIAVVERAIRRGRGWTETSTADAEGCACASVHRVFVRRVAPRIESSPQFR